MPQSFLSSVAVTELIFWGSISPGETYQRVLTEKALGSCLKALIVFRWVLNAVSYQWVKQKVETERCLGLYFIFFKLYWKPYVWNTWYFFLFLLLKSWHGFLLLCFWIAQWVTRNKKWISGWRMQAVKQDVFTGREEETMLLLNILLLQIFQKLLFRRQCYFTRNLS